ncbi:unnamed protein product [Brachionus calyciflorus]|uniref:MULE transposase domain-containing protein n=1 Tax=Brachionus calyciflorus TaxID=104777 RepID=A0A814NWP8_9BILA|nr:unnamed protein product [Brachionus calyciflorus]
MTVEDLRNWVDSLKEIPDNHDQVFTVSEFTFDFKSINFHIFMTTRRLISFTRNANHIATDATYKLLWLNFPILLCGTTDANKAFHPFGMLITKNETENDFTFMFKTVRELSLQLYQWQYSASVFIADAAQANSNGFKNVFELNKRIIVLVQRSGSNFQPLAQKRGRGRPPKMSNVLNTDAEILQSNSITKKEEKKIRFNLS